MGLIIKDYYLPMSTVLAEEEIEAVFSNVLLLQENQKVLFVQSPATPPTLTSDRICSLA